MSDTPRTKFIETISGSESGIDLALACLYISAEEHPGLNVIEYVGRIDALGDRVAKHLASKATGASRGTYDAINAINRVLFEEDGFTGNRNSYYDPANSYLSDVLDRRTGIPITLSILHSEVARRVDHKFEGIGLPGHFILRAGRGEARIFVDPFDSGGLLTANECRRLAARVLGKTSVDDRYLQPVSKRQILHRVLNNLKLIYLRAEDPQRALAAAERIQLLYPTAWENLGDLAKLQAETGNYAAAMESMSRFLELAPPGEDTEAIESSLKAIEDGHPNQHPDYGSDSV